MELRLGIAIARRGALRAQKLQLARTGHCCPEASRIDGHKHNVVVDEACVSEPRGRRCQLRYGRWCREIVVQGNSGTSRGSGDAIITGVARHV
jgi:hypothetical protein